MSRVDLRIRALSAMLGSTGLTSPARMSPRRIRMSRALPIPHGPGLDLVVEGLGRGVRRSDRTVPVRDGERIGVRVYRPSGEGPCPLVVNLHGGGWVIGSLAMAESLCSRLAAGLGAVVVSVDYRLAPEHRFPTAAHDSYDATVWARDHAAELAADGSRLAVVDDSAGGNLAAAVALLARDGGGPAIAARRCSTRPWTSRCRRPRWSRTPTPRC